MSLYVIYKWVYYIGVVNFISKGEKMYRNIYVGENYTRKVTTPLITTDCNAYKIIWDSKCTRGSFKITAIKSDGTSVFDFGTLTEDGIAESGTHKELLEKKGAYYELYTAQARDQGLDAVGE
jgi:hypothetical protein